MPVQQAVSHSGCSSADSVCRPWTILVICSLARLFILQARHFCFIASADPSAGHISICFIPTLVCSSILQAQHFCFIARPLPGVSQAPRRRFTSIRLFRLFKKSQNIWQLHNLRGRCLSVFCPHLHLLVCICCTENSLHHRHALRLPDRPVAIPRGSQTDPMLRIKMNLASV